MISSLRLPGTKVEATFSPVSGALRQPIIVGGHHLLLLEHGGVLVDLLGRRRLRRDDVVMVRSIA